MPKTLPEAGDIIHSRNFRNRTYRVMGVDEDNRRIDLWDIQNDTSDSLMFSSWHHESGKWDVLVFENPPKVETRQVGGTHYAEMDIQPWEVIERAGLDFWEGNVIKYVMRHRAKNGLEDLKKARHYLDYLITREESREG